MPFLFPFLFFQIIFQEKSSKQIVWKEQLASEKQILYVHFS